jgi:hypothetical protein
VLGHHYDNSAKQQQWQGPIRMSRLPAADVGLAEVAAALSAFLLPPAAALLGSEDFNRSWPACGPLA